LIVIDCSLLVDVLRQEPGVRHIERRLFAQSEALCAPGLLRLEFLQVCRSLTAPLGQARVEKMVERFLDLDIEFYHEESLMRRVWKLRHNLTAYDAAYVALAEALRAPLLTRDERMSKTAGHRATIEYVPLAAATR